MCKNFYLETAACLASRIVSIDYEFLNLNVDLIYLSYIHNKASVNKTTNVIKYNFHKADYERFKIYFSCINWYCMFSYAKDIEEV